MKKSDSTSKRVRAKVNETVGRVLGPGHNENRLELTSLKMLELIVALEEEFGIHISEDAPLEQITSSVDTVTDYICRIEGLSLSREDGMAGQSSSSQ